MSNAPIVTPLDEVRACLSAAGAATDPDVATIYVAIARKLLARQLDEVRLVAEAVARAEERFVMPKEKAHG